MVKRLIMSWQKWRDAASGFIVFAFALALMAWVALTAFEAIQDPPFKPLRAFPIVIEGNSFKAGGPLLVRDGICNDTSEPRLVDVYVKMQAQAVNREGSQVIGAIYDLVGTSRQPERVTLYPGCIGTQPVDLVVPPLAHPGLYTVTIEAKTVSSSGQEQILVTASEAFEVGDDGRD